MIAIVWATNDSLTVLGSANIVAASFENSGTINVTNNSLNVTANTFPRFDYTQELLVLMALI